MTVTVGSDPAAVRLQSNPSVDSHHRAASPAETPLKILHIINDLSVGGAEMMLYRLLSQNKAARFEPVVISLMDQGQLRGRIAELGVPVHSPRMRRGLPSPTSILRLVRLVQRIHPDLIQGWLYHGCLAGQLASLAAAERIPVLWSIHCSMYSLSFEKKLTALIVRVCALLSRLASGIVFVSRTSQAQHQELGFKIDKSFVLPNGIDETEFAPSEEARRAVRLELGIEPDSCLIGNVSRFHAMKDHENFLRAASLTAVRLRDVHWVIAGRDLDSNNSRLRAMIERHSLSDRVHLLGERTDIARLVAALDIFCLSSAYGESFPLIVGEAMASGVPCVVTDVGDSSWMVHRTGRVVPIRDAGALADACIELLEMKRCERDALGFAARARVIDLFSLTTVVAEYGLLYETLTRLPTGKPISKPGRA